MPISWCEAKNGASHRRSPTIPGQLQLLRSVGPRNQCHHGIAHLDWSCMDNAYAKLVRAQEHLAELQTAVNAHREQDLSDELSARADDHPTDPALANVTISLKLEAPLRWSLIMGDILTNLRAALDHAVYGHADRRQQLNSAQRKVLKYPIFTERHDWDGIPDRQNQNGTIRKGSKGTLMLTSPVPAMSSVAIQNPPLPPARSRPPPSAPRPLIPLLRRSPRIRLNQRAKNTNEDKGNWPDLVD